MGVLEALAILAAGAAAGAINAVVGSGTLVTFPVLLSFGYQPVIANVSNTLGLVPGSASGAFGYRRELAGQRKRAVPLACASVTGAICGAAALLTLPAAAFKAIVPAFVVLALALILLTPKIGARLAARAQSHSPARRLAVTLVPVFLTGVYGGYFGAAQGIMLLAILGLTLDDSLHRINALKIVLAGAVNLCSGVIFVIFAHVAWGPVALIAVGSTVGGALGARYGRRLPERALRGVIVALGIVTIVRLLA